MPCPDPTKLCPSHIAVVPCRITTSLAISLMFQRCHLFLGNPILLTIDCTWLTGSRVHAIAGEVVWTRNLLGTPPAMRLELGEVVWTRNLLGTPPAMRLELGEVVWTRNLLGTPPAMRLELASASRWTNLRGYVVWAMSSMLP